MDINYFLLLNSTYNTQQNSIGTMRQNWLMDLYDWLTDWLTDQQTDWQFSLDITFHISTSSSNPKVSIPMDLFSLYFKTVISWQFAYNMQIMSKYIISLLGQAITVWWFLFSKMPKQTFQKNPNKQKNRKKSNSPFSALQIYSASLVFGACFINISKQQF